VRVHRGLELAADVEAARDRVRVQAAAGVEALAEAAEPAQIDDRAQLAVGARLGDEQEERVRADVDDGGAPRGRVPDRAGTGTTTGTGAEIRS
jgi:hypothetical protein